jgi:hypothetical protein
VTLLPVYRDFWAKAIGLPTRDKILQKPLLLCEGRYLERHEDRYLYFFKDHTTDQVALVGKPEQLNQLQELQLAELNEQSVRQIEPFAGVEPAFCDLDYGLRSLSEFRPFQDELPDTFRVASLESPEALGLSDFLTELSQDERDILDLCFENEFSMGIYQNNKLLAVSRALKVRDTDIADITVVVHPGERKKGWATPLVSAQLEQVLSLRLIPKYRVEATNLASRRVAERLGFVALYSLLAWETAHLRWPQDSL